MASTCLAFSAGTAGKVSMTRLRLRISRRALIVRWALATASGEKRPGLVADAVARGQGCPQPAPHVLHCFEQAVVVLLFLEPGQKQLPEPTLVGRGERLAHGVAVDARLNSAGL